MRTKRTDSRGRAYKKSQLQIQIYVNRRPSEFERAIRKSLPSFDSAVAGINWVSPLEAEGFAEYRDAAFLQAVGRADLTGALREFWPKGGAHWDALATLHLRGGGQGILLVEAKSYVEEMKSRMKAKARKSVEKIRAALTSTKRWCGAAPDADWTQPYYQLANRLAHLAFLEERGVKVWFVQLCVVGDPHAPTTRAEWGGGIAVALERLGIERIPSGRVGDVFLPGRARSELLSG